MTAFLTKIKCTIVLFVFEEPKIMNAGAHVVLNVYSGLFEIKALSFTVILKMALLYADHLKNHLIFCGPSHPGSQLVNTGWAGTISSSESSTQPANKDKMTWKSGKEMHFVMDNIETWKTTCEPSVLPWTNLHIFTVQLFLFIFLNLNSLFK